MSAQNVSDQRIHSVPGDAIADEIAMFLIDRQARGVSPGTLAFYRSKLSAWQRILADAGITDPLDITPAHIRTVMIRLAGTHTPGGQHTYYRALKTFLRWYDQEYEPAGWRNPITKVPGPRLVDNPLPPLTLADLTAMLKTCDRSFNGQRDRAVLLALLDTGCRASEFVALDLDDLDLQTGSIAVRHGKGRKLRTVFLGVTARREVARYLRRRGPGPGPLWVSGERSIDRGSRLTYWGLRQIVRRRAAAAGIPCPALHSFRRAFALCSLRNGMDIYSLQRLMGHADLGVLRRYLAQTESDLADAHRKAGPVDNLL